MGKLYMGFDAGTQSVKVAVYDEEFLYEKWVVTRQM